MFGSYIARNLNYIPQCSQDVFGSLQNPSLPVLPVVSLPDLVDQTAPNSSNVPNPILELGPLPVLINIHGVLEPTVPQGAEHWLQLVGLIWVDVILVIAVLEEIMTCPLGCVDGISEEEVLKPLLTKQDSS